MSLKNLPKIEAIEGQRWQMREDALDRWNPSIAAQGTSENTISILDVVGEDVFGEGVTSKRISAALRLIGDQEVTVNVNSPGGDFFEGVAIYNILRAHSQKVTVRVMGLAASAASVIAMAGDEIQIGQAGFLMIHDAWTIGIGNRHDMRELADTMETFDNSMAEVYAARTGRKKDEMSALMDAETWFSGSEAIEFGLADEFLPNDLVTERDSQSRNARKSRAVLEASVRAQNPNLSRSECRALFADAKIVTPSADDEGKPSAAETTSFALEMINALRA